MFLVSLSLSRLFQFHRPSLDHSRCPRARSRVHRAISLPLSFSVPSVCLCRSVNSTWVSLSPRMIHADGCALRVPWRILPLFISSRGNSVDRIFGSYIPIRVARRAFFSPLSSFSLFLLLDFIQLKISPALLRVSTLCVSFLLSISLPLSFLVSKSLSTTRFSYNKPVSPSSSDIYAPTYM